jgi:hypothetical protein
MPDESLLEALALPEGDTFDVDPFLVTAHEGLDHDEIFGAAGPRKRDVVDCIDIS